MEHIVQPERQTHIAGRSGGLVGYGEDSSKDALEDVGTDRQASRTGILIGLPIYRRGSLEGRIGSERDF